MKDLIARLEEAEAGSRELSDEVLIMFGWLPHSSGDWIRPDGATRKAAALPSPTESVDAALALVPDGWRWFGDENPREEVALVRIIGPRIKDDAKGAAKFFCAALCAAALRAKEG